MSFADAQRAADRGDLDSAIRQLRAVLKSNPNQTELWRVLTGWLARNNDTEGQVAALEAWADVGGPADRYEALDRLNAVKGAGTGLFERARAVLRRQRLRLAARKLTDERSPLGDRISFLIYTRRLDDAETVLFNVSRDQRMNLSPQLWRGLQDLYRADGRALDLLGLIDNDLTVFSGRYGLLGRIGTDLIDAERLDEAEAVVALMNEDANDTSQRFHLRARLAEARGDLVGAQSVLDEWIAKMPLERVAKVAQARLRVMNAPAASMPDIVESEQWQLLTQFDAIRLIDRLVAEGAYEGALAVATSASERFPTNRPLAEAVAMMAEATGRDQLARETRTRTLLLQELEPDMLRMLGGTGALAAQGGRGALHRALLEGLREGGKVDGILDLARLAMGSLEVLLTIRNGMAREAKELHAHGSADWMARRDDADRAATLVRALCALAMSTAPDDLRPSTLLMELAALLAEDSPLNRQLCRAELASAHIANQGASRELWSASLCCDDPGLWAQIESQHGERGDRVMPFAELEGLGADLPGLTQRHAQRHLTKAIRVWGPRFSGSIDLGLPNRDEFIAGPTEVTVFAGFLVSPDGRHLLNLSHNSFVPRPTGALRQVGTWAGVVDTSGDEVRIDTPVLFVPGLRAHYNNYFHFGGQVLPRILGLLAEAAHSELSVAIPDFAPGFVTDMLAVGGVSTDRILRLPSHSPVRLTQAVIVSPSLHDWQCAAEDITAARRVLREPSWPPRAGSRKLFLSRPPESVARSGRSLVNTAALIEVAVAQGYEVIDSGRMSQVEQRALFADAAEICGPTGAALTNSLYLPEGARVICLSPHETCRTYFPGLTLGQDVQFRWVLGSFDQQLIDSKRFPHRPYSIQPELLERALTR